MTRVGFLSGYPIPRKNPISGIKNPRDIPKLKNPESREFWLSPGDKNPETQKNLETKKNPEPRALLKIPGIFIKFRKKSRWSENRDFGIFGILHSGFFRGLKIPIPIPGISGFSGFSNPDPDPRDFRDFSI